LGREIIGPQLALQEVQDFCESRVPRVPPIQSPEEWQKYAQQIRADVLEKVVYRGQAAAWRDAETQVEWLDEMAAGPGYKIKKLRYEALPGLWIPALLYEPEKLAAGVPAVLNVNGHDGKGKAADYKQLRCINLAKRGMLALNLEWLGMGQLRGEGFGHYRMNQLDLCGSSGLAPFYLAMKRGLDVLLSHPQTDTSRVAVAGLSGGGWQTIFISSLDTRVTLANPVAGYSSFLTRIGNHSDLGDSEQTPCDLATVADYAHLTALMAPRGLLLTYNAKDNCCFASGHALPPLVEVAAPIYKLLGKENALRSHVNEDPGDHNFGLDNRQALYRMLKDEFYMGSAEFPPDEIDSQTEVKSAEELNVPLPEGNEDFNTLAKRLMQDLPRDGQLPVERAAAERWQANRRERLKKIVRAHEYKVQARVAAADQDDQTKTTFWQLRLGDTWTIPAVELERTGGKGTTIIIADGGRKGAADLVEQTLSAGQRAVAIDPFYLGESKIASRDFLFALLVSSVGERPLGIQASQLAAVARWLNDERQAGPVTIAAAGPRSSLAALVATALEPKAVAGAHLGGSLGSLKEVIEQNLGVNTAPEYFCFGLLEQFDIAQLTALAAPRPVSFPAASDRVKRELASLRDWFAHWGAEFELAK
jgi:hypothetical protein